MKDKIRHREAFNFKIHEELKDVNKKSVKESAMGPVVKQHNKRTK